MDFRWDSSLASQYNRIAAEAADWPRQKEKFYTRAQWRRCAALGLLGLPLPRAYGGSGYGALATARLIEAFGLGSRDMGLVFAAAAHTFACAMPVAEYAEEPLRARVLPKLCSGEWIAGNAISEAEAGSDVNSLRTTAVRDGDDYVLNGTKSFVSNGPVADVFVVYAVSDPTLGHLGISAFLLERGTPGVAAGGPKAKASLRSCPAGELMLKDCRVPASHRIGAEGSGAGIFQRSMQWERTCLLSAYNGLMERLLTRCLEHAANRRQFNRPIGTNQAVSHRLADARIRLEAARLLLWQACWKLDQGERAVLDVSMAKVAISENAVQTALEAVHLFGGAGILEETGIEGTLRDALPSTIFSGTSEMQREIMAREMGL
ncbi:acyl-CoA dehydrogenase family protein [Streptomyces sp. NPDC048611]|uniref:acyl-CoA dehydrogenase family protein n=1 Tax=Streptomyces sp. NPDC048611 TaxID=3155635 RepID=UPI0034471A34